MNSASNSVDTIEYRLALIDTSSEMIMCTDQSTDHCLPRVVVPKWSRHTEEINDEIYRKWGLRTIVVSFLPPVSRKPTCAVAEVITSRTDAPYRLVSRSPDSISELTMDEWERLNSMIVGSAASRGPFARLGWFREALDWIHRSVKWNGRRLSEDFRQYYAHETFALVRFGVIGDSAFWLKAAGEPNAHECVLTAELSRLFPQYLPRLIAVRKDWNAWLAAEAGTSIGNCRHRETLTSAVKALADLQIRSVGEVASIRATGCIDRSLPRVHSHLSEMFSFLDEVMRLQTSPKVMPLTTARLKEIHTIVDDACERMENLRIPACLVNEDINLYNILFDGASFRFIDWAEGGVGNPFLTLQQIIQHVIYEGEHLDWVPSLCEAYKIKWLAVLEERQIDYAFRLMPLLTIADYLYFRGDWLHSSRRHDPAFQSTARSLARYMDRAAIEISTTGVLQS